MPVDHDHAAPRVLVEHRGQRPYPRRTVHHDAVAYRPGQDDLLEQAARGAGEHGDGAGRRLHPGQCLFDPVQVSRDGHARTAAQRGVRRQRSDLVEQVGDPGTHVRGAGAGRHVQRDHRVPVGLERGDPAQRVGVDHAGPSRGFAVRAAGVVGRTASRHDPGRVVPHACPTVPGRTRRPGTGRRHCRSGRRPVPPSPGGRGRIGPPAVPPASGGPPTVGRTAHDAGRHLC